MDIAKNAGRQIMAYPMNAGSRTAGGSARVLAPARMANFIIIPLHTRGRINTWEGKHENI